MFWISHLRKITGLEESILEQMFLIKILFVHVYIIGTLFFRKFHVDELRKPS